MAQDDRPKIATVDEFSQENVNAFAVRPNSKETQVLQVYKCAQSYRESEL